MLAFLSLKDSHFEVGAALGRFRAQAFERFRAQSPAWRHLQRWLPSVALQKMAALLRSPELLTHAQRMGAYLRYRSALTLRLSELVILINARLWDQPVEWAIHVSIAAEAGLAADSIEAISQGRLPAGLAADERIVYGFSMELHQHKAVSDATWAQSLALLGEQGVVDLIGLNGYYSFFAMTMNACRTPVPEGATSVLPALK